MKLLELRHRSALGAVRYPAHVLSKPVSGLSLEELGAVARRYLERNMRRVLREALSCARKGGAR